MTEAIDFSNTKNGLLYKDYYNSGELFSTYNPIDGKETFYYRDGGLCRESFSREGRLFGEMKLYTEYGEVHTIKTYNNGRLVGEKYFETKKRERTEKEIEDILNIQTNNNGEAAAKAVKKVAAAKRKADRVAKKVAKEKLKKEKIKAVKKKVVAVKTKNIFKTK